MPLRFSFDPVKDVANIRKHGLSLEAAGLVYFSERKITFTSNLAGEGRMIDIARIDESDHVLVLVYVERALGIRVISLRRASKQERRRYAAAQQV